MIKNGEIRNIVSNLAKLGVQAKITKSRVELSKTLALPQPPQASSHSS
ncbi:Lmo0850 family protein [Planococcus maitriensis]|nr:Lmo0850 family protein [Planococcus maitriensis]